MFLINIMESVFWFIYKGHKQTKESVQRHGTSKND